MGSKISKTKVIVAIFLLFTVLIGVILFLTLKPSLSQPRHTIDERVYSVQEIINIFNSNPESLKGKKVKVKARYANAMMGMGCDDLLVLIDDGNYERYKELGKYNNQSDFDKASKEIQAIPQIETGPSLEMEKSIFPTEYAVYEGHFYDNWATSKCKPDGWKRFVIERKVQEMTTGKDK